MKTVFKKGMTVYWGELKGDVKSVTGTRASRNPILIEFENNTILSFTIDGRIDDGLPIVISITPYTLNGFSQEPQIEKDILVYVREKESDKWEMRFYSHYEDGFYNCFLNQLKSNETKEFTGWKFVETENPILK